MIRPSKSPRTANTLRLVHLMEEQQRLEIAKRITQLREKSRWTQPDIADKLGLTLRGYQKIEQRGTTKFERAEELAEIHGVDPVWIWEGQEQGPVPDVLGSLEPATPSTEADGEAPEWAQQILDQQAELLARIDAVLDEQERLRQLQEPGEQTAEGS